MTSPTHTPALAHPRWDGRRALFEIEHEGQRYSCAISSGALQELSGTRHFKPADLPRYFAEAHGRIEAIAVAKLLARKSGLLGVLSIWADDIDDPPPTSSPVAMQQIPGVARSSS
ncbi:DUF1488 family protein [Plastoroseomonas hellenica]|uniref:DUF1488 family protein n=1 Tax=Plastoroseomonas hellenica TaxID=2687306 RepID=UPI001BAB485C|nr:DUF1488 family protein [Plastoroseomonas hellenica]MBR0645640.1 DUF1488 domain-containing protein [Plastoroseomonas hellenica]